MPVQHLLRNRNFVLLWFAYGISAMGDHISELAILKTRDALDPTVDVTPLTARMTFMFFVPFFLLGPFTGLLADRLPRRALMISADIIRGGLMCVFGYLLAQTAAWGSWGGFVPLLLVGVFAALFSPARSALLPTLVNDEQLVRANGMIAGLGIIATMAAALIGGYLADHYEPKVAFRVDAATFIASAVCLAMMRPPSGAAHAADPSAEESPFAALADGLRYVRGHRHVRELLMIAALVWFCGPVVNSVIPAVVRDTYGGTFTDISGYRALLGLGFILGATIVTILGRALRAEIAITWGLFGISLAIGIFAASTMLPWSTTALSRLGAVGITLAGLFGVSVMAAFDALLQRTVANRFRGRVFGFKDLVCTGALLIATGALGVPTAVRMDRWVGWLLLGVSVLTFVAGAVTLRVRLRRGLDRPWISFLRHLVEFVSKFWWGLERLGPVTVPRTGPVIVTANHRSIPDPPLLSACVPYRVLSFLIAAEYANLPIVRTVVRAAECIPVRRGTRETAATKEALRKLEAGNAVAIFIEGGIAPPGERRRPKDGVALLALRTGAPVIPAYISGTRYTKGVLAGCLARHRARVRFGPPVDLSDFDDHDRGRATVRAATERIYAAIIALAPEGAASAAPSREHASSWIKDDCLPVTDPLPMDSSE